LWNNYTAMTRIPECPWWKRDELNHWNRRL